MSLDLDTAYGFIEHDGLIAGMRGDFPPEIALPVTEVLLESGIRVFEFTMNSTQPIAAMQAVKHAYGDSACVGMGTVLETQAARRALDAGADFIVSPAFNPDVVRLAQSAGVLVAPGVQTPTECVNAWALGVRLLKLFSIGTLGVEHFKAIRGPLDHMNFLCNGGMTLDNAPAFIRAGAVACGMAGWLTGDGHLPLETIRSRAQALRQAVDGVRPVQAS
jgi:2-dehydro-3-deoxyphosphogluconate aldolase/(4S)-4-hydroxy-2-oxoglutarate aldolase